MCKLVGAVRILKSIYFCAVLVIPYQNNHNKIHVRLKYESNKSVYQRRLCPKVAKIIYKWCNLRYNLKYQVYRKSKVLKCTCHMLFVIQHTSKKKNYCSNN